MCGISGLLLKNDWREKENVLMRNVWCLLTSSEMVAQTRFYGILYFSICLLLCWLTGKTHPLLDYVPSWGREGRPLVC